MGESKSRHPSDSYLRPDAFPSVWCPGCGIGIAVSTFLQAVTKAGLSEHDVCMISSGISCTGKIPDYLSGRTEIFGEGSIIRRAAELKTASPRLTVVVFLNDNDFLLSGLDDLAEICRENADLVVVYVNSFIFHVFWEHKECRNPPLVGETASSGRASLFNLPLFAADAGASFVARWTPLHVRRLRHSMQKALQTRGFAFIEVVSPCLMYYASAGGLGQTLDRMGGFLEQSVIRHDAPSEQTDMRDLNRIVVGVFVAKTDEEKSSSR